MSGPGAGGPQTASAVLGDVISAMIPPASTPPATESLKIVTDVTSAFYLHLEVADEPGVLAEVAQVLSVRAAAAPRGTPSLYLVKDGPCDDVPEAVQAHNRRAEQTSQPLECRHGFSRDRRCHLLAAVLEADLGRHRKIGKFRILRPLGVAALIIPLYLKAVTTTGNGLSLEIAAASAGIVLGLIATSLMGVYRSPDTNKPVSHAGLAYPALWVVVIGTRAAFSYGSTHWFSQSLATWTTQHSVTTAAITDALIFSAVAMLLTRTMGLAIRARHATNLRSDQAAHAPRAAV